MSDGGTPGTPDIRPAVVRYTCRADSAIRATRTCDGECGHAEAGLELVGISARLGEPDGQTRALHCARCGRWNLYRAAESQAA